MDAFMSVYEDAQGHVATNGAPLAIGHALPCAADNAAEFIAGRVAVVGAQDQPEWLG